MNNNKPFQPKPAFNGNKPRQPLPKPQFVKPLNNTINNKVNNTRFEFNYQLLNDRYFKQILNSDLVNNTNLLILILLNFHILYYLMSISNDCPCAYGLSKNIFITMILVQTILNIVILFKIKIHSIIVIIYLISLCAYLASGFLFVSQVEDDVSNCYCAHTDTLVVAKYLLRIMLVVLIFSISMILYNYVITLN